VGMSSLRRVGSNLMHVWVSPRPLAATADGDVALTGLG